MDWKDLGSRIVSGGAKVLGGLVAGGPVGAGLAAVKVLAGEFGVDADEAQKDPSVLAKAIEMDPEHAVRLVEVEANTKVELQRIALQHHELEIQREAQHIAAETAALGEVNQTMRAELASTDRYRAGWRPFWGYASGTAWFLQCVGIVGVIGYAVVAKPSDAGAILGGLSSVLSAMTVMWGMALAVLGVTVHQRSQDKRVAAGAALPPGIIGAIATRIAKPGGVDG